MNADPKRLLLLGGAGSGKSTFVRQQFREADPDRRLLLLPTSTLVRHVRHQLTESDGQAVLDSGITTFLNLSLSLLAHRTSARLAAESQCLACLRDLLSSDDEALEAYRAPAQYPGFGKTLLGWLHELRQAGLSHVDLAGSSIPRHRTLSHVMREYEQRLARIGLLDLEMALQQASEVLEAERDPAFELIAADGFYEFTQLQADFLTRLIQQADSCTISLIHPAGREFEPVERSRAWLSGLGFEERRLEGGRRFKTKALADIERGLFSKNYTPQEDTEGLIILEAADPEDEAMWVARDVARLRKSGYRYDEIIIIRRSLKQAARIWKRAFDEKGVPLLILRPEPLMNCKAAGELVGIFKILVGDLGAMPWLMSAYGLNIPEDEFETFVSKWRAQDHIVSLQGLLELADVNELYSIRNACKSFMEWAEAFRNAADCDAAIEVLNGILEEVGVRGATCLYNQGIGQEIVERARALAGIRDCLSSSGRVLQALGGRPGSEQIVDSIVADMEATSLAPLDRRADIVYMVDVLEARNWESRAVYFCGLTEREVPPKAFQDALFSDEDRLAVSPSNRLRTAAERTEEERLLFYLAATRARERFVLSYPSNDGSGTMQSKAFWLTDLCRLFNPDTIERVAPGQGRLPDLGSAVVEGDLKRISADANGRLNAGLKPSAEAAALRSVLTKRDAGFRGLLHRADYKGRARLSKPQRLLDLRSHIEPISATRADAFAQCPFRFFCEYILRLEVPKQPPVFDSLLEGLIVHEVLRKAFEDKETDTWPDILDRQLENAYKKAMPDDPHSVRLRLVSALKETIRSEEDLIRSTGVSPCCFEIGFGPNRKHRCDITVPPDLHGSFPGNEIHLKGRIDRVDVARQDEQEVGMVIDYKMSSAGWSNRRDEVDKGLANQPAIYLIALQQALGMVPGGMLYITCTDGKRDGIKAKERLPENTFKPGKNSRVLEGRQLDAWIDVQRARIIELVRRIYSGSIVAGPARLEKCGPDNCPYADVCRYRPEWEGKEE